jgi:hypothetical protein
VALGWACTVGTRVGMHRWHSGGHAPVTPGWACTGDLALSPNPPTPNTCMSLIDTHYCYYPDDGEHLWHDLGAQKWTFQGVTLDGLKRLRVSQLTARLREENLSQSGVKAVLAARLLDYLQRAPAPDAPPPPRPSHPGSVDPSPVRPARGLWAARAAAVDASLEPLGFRVLAQAPDGNCGFRALCDAVGRPQAEHMSLRKQLNAWILQHPTVGRGLDTGGPSRSHTCAHILH